MDNYIQFPRYSIYLIPNKLFIDQVEKLLLKNNVKYDNLEISQYGLHYAVKAPFYLSHLFNEEELINSFQEYFSSNQNKSCLLYTSPSPRDKRQSRMTSSA